MRAVYRNPKELATAVKDLVDEFQDNLLTEDKLQEKHQKIADANEERFIKNGKVENKIANILEEERLEIIYNYLK